MSPVPHPDRLHTEGRMALKRCRHGLFMFNVNDRFIGRSLDLYGEWCETEITIIAQILRPGDVAIDAGANIGTHTVPLAKAVGTAGTVLAFEPQRLAFQILCGNVALNSLGNVRCIQSALGEKPGQVTVPQMDQDHVQNFGAMALGNHPSGESVSVLTIDGLKLPSCRLIKADVEGMEVNLLRGASNTIRRHRPALFLESNKPDRTERLSAALRDLDYSAFWHVAGYFNPNNFAGNAENAFRTIRPESNLLCLPAEAANSISGLERLDLGSRPKR